MENGIEAYLYVIAGAISLVFTAISLIVMIVNDIRSHKQTIYRFDSLDKGDERLSAEHNRLEGQQNVLKDKVFEYIDRENGRRESLTSILPQQDVLTQIQLLYDKILALSEENTKLKYQIRQLQEKLNHMHEEVSENSRENNRQLTEQEKAIEQAVDEIMSQEELPEQDSGMEHEM